MARRPRHNAFDFPEQIMSPTYRDCVNDLMIPITQRSLDPLADTNKVHCCAPDPWSITCSICRCHRAVEVIFSREVPSVELSNVERCMPLYFPQLKYSQVDHYNIMMYCFPSCVAVQWATQFPWLGFTRFCCRYARLRGSCIPPSSISCNRKSYHTRSTLGAVF